MLRPFAHPVACCCAKFETGQTFSYVQTDATTPTMLGVALIFDKCAHYFLAAFSWDVPSWPKIACFSPVYRKNVLKCGEIPLLTSLKLFFNKTREFAQVTEVLVTGSVCCARMAYDDSIFFVGKTRDSCEYWFRRRLVWTVTHRCQMHAHHYDWPQVESK